MTEGNKLAAAQQAVKGSAFSVALLAACSEAALLGFVGFVRRCIAFKKRRACQSGRASVGGNAGLAFRMMQAKPVIEKSVRTGRERWVAFALT